MCTSRFHGLSRLHFSRRREPAVLDLVERIHHQILCTAALRPSSVSTMVRRRGTPANRQRSQPTSKNSTQVPVRSRDRFRPPFHCSQRSAVTPVRQTVIHLWHRQHGQKYRRLRRGRQCSSRTEVAILYVLRPSPIIVVLSRLTRKSKSPSNPTAPRLTESSAITSLPIPLVSSTFLTRPAPSSSTPFNIPPTPLPSPLSVILSRVP